MKFNKEKTEREISDILNSKNNKEVLKKIKVFLKGDESISFPQFFEVIEKYFLSFESYKEFWKREALLKIIKSALWKIEFKKGRNNIGDEILEMVWKGLVDRDGRVRRTAYHVIGDFMINNHSNDFREKIRKKLEKLIWDEKDSIDLSKVKVLEEMKSSVFKNACLLHNRWFFKIINDEDWFREEIYFKVLAEMHKNNSKFLDAYKFAIYEWQHRNEQVFDEDDDLELFNLSKSDRESAKSKSKMTVIEFRIFLQENNINFDFNNFIKEIEEADEMEIDSIQNKWMIKFVDSLNGKADNMNEGLFFFMEVLNTTPRKFFDGDTPYERFKMIYGSFPDKENQIMKKRENNFDDITIKVGNIEIPFKEHQKFLKEMEKEQEDFRKLFNDKVLPRFKKEVIQNFGKELGEDIYLTALAFMERVWWVGFLEYSQITKDFAFKEFPKWWQTHVLGERSEEDIVKDLENFDNFVNNNFNLKIGDKVASPF